MLSELQRIYFSNGEGWWVGAAIALPAIIAFARGHRTIVVLLLATVIVLAHHMALSVIGAIVLNPLINPLFHTPGKNLLQIAADVLHATAIMHETLKFGTIGLWLMLVVWASFGRKLAPATA